MIEAAAIAVESLHAPKNVTQMNAVQLRRLQKAQLRQMLMDYNIVVPESSTKEVLIRMLLQKAESPVIDQKAKNMKMISEDLIDDERNDVSRLESIKPENVEPNVELVGKNINKVLIKEKESSDLDDEAVHDVSYVSNDELPERMHPEEQKSDENNLEDENIARFNKTPELTHIFSSSSTSSTPSIASRVSEISSLSPTPVKPVQSQKNTPSMLSKNEDNESTAVAKEETSLVVESRKRHLFPLLALIIGILLLISSLILIFRVVGLHQIRVDFFAILAKIHFAIKEKAQRLLRK